LLIADEPTTALDVTIQAQILNLIRRLQQEHHMAVLLITHNLRVVNQVADRVLVMYAGRIVEQGDRHTVFTDPRHPYTRRLLQAIPGRSARGERLVEIPGRVPPATAFPDFCRFADRCPMAIPQCREAPPPLTKVGPDHDAACLRSHEADVLP
jgi:oligopeptide/dipeptide ABC transporter ATP-binding protein